MCLNSKLLYSAPEYLLYFLTQKKKAGRDYSKVLQVHLSLM